MTRAPTHGSRIRAPIWFMLGVFVAMLLAACQPAGQQQQQPQQQQQSSGGEPARNRTLIITPWSDRTGPLTNPENWNIYQSGNGNQREMGSKTIFEDLFYTNLNTGELIPWQAESYEYNDDYTTITVKLRQGVEWSDGVA
ncbi:MAG TPA: ABC transporter substrate-binding protein, partial [Anaerolineales bacterium]